MYIYRKCDKKCKKVEVSYGYPMGMLWVSYGKVRWLAGCWRVVVRLKAGKHIDIKKKDIFFAKNIFSSCACRKKVVLLQRF
jgi:hypothetical protein